MSFAIRSAGLVMFAAGISIATAACSANVQESEGSGEEAVRQALPSFGGYWARGGAFDRVPAGEFASLQLNPKSEFKCLVPQNGETTQAQCANQGGIPAGDCAAGDGSMGHELRGFGCEVQTASNGTYEAFYGTCQRIGRGGACLGSPEGKIRQGKYSISRLRDRDGTTQLALTETGTANKAVYTIRTAITAAVVGQAPGIELVKDGKSEILLKNDEPARCQIVGPICNAGERQLAPGEKAETFRQSSNCAGTVYCAAAAGAPKAALGETCGNGVFGTPKIECAAGLDCRFPRRGTAPTGPSGSSSALPGTCVAATACQRATVLELFCTANFDPVCGCDGNTYSNACAANNAVTNSTAGACR